MEAFISAVLGDLVSRSISFVMDRYFQQPMGAEEKLQSLHHVLLRIATTIQEAEGRHITNQAMLQKLQMMRNWMYKGHYLLDTLNYRMLQRDRVVNSEVSGNHSFALPKYNPAKRLRFSARTAIMEFEGEEIKAMENMLASLQSIVDDMRVFAVFLKNYLPMYREPYSKHFVLDKCMFGRQAEMERIITFLLREEPLGAESLGVLPIIGLARVGKSTLLEHVCYDERVRGHFSSIVLSTGNDVENKSLADLRNIDAIKHRNQCATHERSLIIIEYIEDVVLDEARWRRLYSSRSSMPCGSKIIITSRSERFMYVGTTQPLLLNLLPQEAYWYFFKVIAFGSSNPEEHPLLASIAMDIAMELNGSFIGANHIGFLLRTNFSIQFWRSMLNCLRNVIERNITLFGEHPMTLLCKGRPIYFWRNPRAPKFFLTYNYRTCPKDDGSRVMLLDYQTGVAKARGKFEAVLWRSRIPPFHSYLISCKAQAPTQMVVKKKRPLQHG